MQWNGITIGQIEKSNQLDKLTERIQLENIKYADQDITIVKSNELKN